MLIFLKANKTKQSFVKILRINQILKSIGSSTKANYDKRCCQTHRSFQCVPPQQAGHHPNQTDAAPLVVKKNQARTRKSQHTSPGSDDSTQGTLPTQQLGRKQGFVAAPLHRRQPSARMLSRRTLLLHMPGAGEPPGSLSTLC